MDGALAKKIKAIRQSMDLDQAAFGELLGVSQSTVTRWEKGAEPSGTTLKRIASLANTTVERLLDIADLKDVRANTIPVVGYVGAGATVVPYDDYAQGEGFDVEERPSFVTGQAVAVEVKGDSLLPIAEDGWRLVYTGEQTILEGEVLNRLCVVKLADGRILVKRLIKGSKSQRYHLVSSNAPLIEDVEVVWAAKVKAIIPK